METPGTPPTLERTTKRALAPRVSEVLHCLLFPRLGSALQPSWVSRCVWVAFSLETAPPTRSPSSARLPGEGSPFCRNLHRWLKWMERSSNWQTKHLCFCGLDMAPACSTAVPVSKGMRGDDECHLCIIRNDWTATSGRLGNPVPYLLGPPVVPVYPFLGEGSPTKID